MFVCVHVCVRVCMCVSQCNLALITDTVARTWFKQCAGSVGVVQDIPVKDCF